jgi:large repetitive protein
MLLVARRLTPHTRRTRALLVLLVLLCVALLVAVQAAFFRQAEQAGAATTVPNATCGQVITVSITLNTDLGPCPGDGLVVGKGSITINLGGHTIRGNDTAQLNYGIEITQWDSVTVTNGTIRDFDGGVKIQFQSNSNHIQNLRITSNQRDGVYIESGSSNVVTANTIFANPSGAGVQILTGSANQITNNTLQSNSNGIVLFPATNTTVSGNKATSHSARGIGIFTGSSGTILTSNITNSNGTGITSDDPTAKFTTNTADYNTGIGIDAEPGSIDGNGNKAQDNGDARQCTNIVCLPV